MSLRNILSAVAGLVLLASVTPALASAQAFNGNCNANSNTWYQNWNWNNNTNTNCTSGTVLVYVQVLNNNNGNNSAASNFTVGVSGLNASPSSFQGSVSGTLVSVAGNYQVTANQLNGYSATYSSGCSGTVLNGQQASCVVTENTNTGYTTYPNTYYPNQYYPINSYPYDYNYSAPLYCSPSNQTVTIGTNLTFTAQGGQYSQFNWSNSSLPNNTSYNVGQSYTTTFLSPGVQTVTVTNGSQSATCSVTVVGYPVAGYGNNGYNYNYPNVINPVVPVNTGYTTINGSYPNVYVTPAYVPRLPNTGFDPQNGAAFAFAAVLLLAASFMAYPYVRQAFSIVLR